MFRKTDMTPLALVPRQASRRMGLVLGLGLLLLSIAAIAQEPPLPPAHAGRFQMPQREQMEMVRMFRLVHTLGIDESQATKVFPAFSQHLKKKESLERQRQDLRLELQKQLAEEGAADQNLLKQMAKIRRVESEITNLELAFQQRLETLLSPRQQAQLMLFEDSFRQDLQDTVRRMRGLNGRSQGGGFDRSTRRGRNQD